MWSMYAIGILGVGLMKQAIVLVAVLLAISAPGAAKSTDHAYMIAAQGDTALAYVNIKSFSSRGNVITAWAAWVYDPPMDDRAIGAVSYSLTQDVYDCEARRSKGLYSTYYDTHGRVLDAGGLPGRWEPVVPSSLGESVFEYVCGGWKKSNSKNAISDLDAAVELALSFLAIPSAERDKLVEESKRHTASHPKGN
jgi:hypothetical protein